MLLEKDTAIAIGELEIHYLLDGVVSGAASGMFEVLVPPGARVPPPHSHSDNEEMIYCLEGTVRTTVGGETRDLKPGEGRYTPLGVVHSFNNPGDRPARALFVLTPDIGSQFFRDIAAVANLPGGPDPAKIAAVMNSYGLALALPEEASASG